MTRLLQKAIDRVRALSEEDQNRIARLMLGATVRADQAEDEPARERFWNRALECMHDLPAEEIDRLPSDGATEHDHYIYGTPKRNA